MPLTFIFSFFLPRQFPCVADGPSFFLDLAETEWLFEGSGDIQFDTYRRMQKATSNKWDQVRSDLCQDKRTEKEAITKDKRRKHGEQDNRCLFRNRR